MTSEVMGDTTHDTLERDEEEEENEELENQVLYEIGIDINQELVKAPLASCCRPARRSGGSGAGGEENLPIRWRKVSKWIPQAQAISGVVHQDKYVYSTFQY